ncbi:MGMT family protein [Tautonia rosea]|uniref:MGMT family protein n=1 Tax=Tautonia rosea TaxID=2728037 RepID=UPI001475DE2E|nr:MGMT family protein [Tautonia rosea]
MPRSPAFMRIKNDVLAIVGSIPEGRVTTFAAIGRHLDVMARHVAYILATLTDDEQDAIPWYRVLADGGTISKTRFETRGREQLDRLRAEGLRFGPRHKVEGFDRLFWSPKD